MAISRLLPALGRRAVSVKAQLAATGALAAVLSAVSPSATQTAIANGDTRVINLFHAHTQESISIAFRVNGSYDPAALQKLNWFLRDWRNDDVTRMDPRLFDVIWETQRGAGSEAPLRVQSAYRSPDTNAMLRRRSRAVAEHSQHMLGKAMDLHVSDVPIARMRETAMRMQRGGVGYYPSSGFVHLDVGSVRAWPRMSYDQLARLFPDGKTVHLPSNGQPLARYEEARAELAARGGDAPTLAQVRSKGFFATLFGLDDEEEAPRAVAQRGRAQPGRIQTAGLAPTAYAPSPDENSAAGFFAADDARRSGTMARAEANRPRGQTYMGPAPTAAAVSAPTPAPAPVQVAALQAPPAISSRIALPPAESAKLSAPNYVDMPLPPRRPADALIAAFAPADVPLPPQRPGEFSLVARAEAPAPKRASGDQIASLIGAAPVGKVAATPGLPPLITDGAGPAGLLSYAPAEQASAPAPAVRTVRQARAAPVATNAVGLRAARGQKASELSAARLDRSNFAAMTAPGSIADASPSTALGATVAPLRAAARKEASAIMFAPPSESPVLVGALVLRR
ncbi:MAG: hypothetical protein JWN93_2556 [Hyphomicrobiales bacterium]|nr:hypothetical protein [Hyphomicrobiales bacterium]